MDLNEIIEFPEDATLEDREPIIRLSRDLAKSAATMDRRSAKFLVNAYYSMQHYRIISNSHIRVMKEAGQAHELVDWVYGQTDTLEGRIKAALNTWTSAHFIGRWAKSICGVGPVIAAGLLSHIELKTVRTITDDDGATLEETIIRSTPGAIWSFAGLSQIDAGECIKCHGDGFMTIGADSIPCQHCFGRGRLSTSPVWEKKKKRPWNADLRVLIAFKLGESFVKVQSRKTDYYGKVYAKRKELEIERNNAHLFERQAAAVLAAKDIGKDTDAYKYYSQGLLPPAHIHARARRYAAKMFISHYHYMAFRYEFGEPPPKPYPISHMGHAKWIPPPNMNFENYFNNQELLKGSTALPSQSVVE